MRFLSEIPYPVGSKERKKALGQRYYDRNKEAYAKRWKDYKLANVEKCRKIAKDRHNTIDGRAKSLFNSAKKRAIQRNYDLSIDVPWLIEKLKIGKCELTRISFVFETRLNGHRNPYAPSLDRRDNSQGYTKENCRVILWALNMGFADWGQENYTTIARALIGYDL